MAFWILLDDSLALAELLPGAGAAALGASLAELVQYQSATHFRMRIEWVTPALRLPVDVARDTIVVLRAWDHRWLIASSILVGGAVLRVAGGVFYGLGDPPSEDPQMRQEVSEETSETDADKRRTPWSMIVPPVVLVALAAAVGVLPHIGSIVQSGAVRFQDRPAMRRRCWEVLTWPIRSRSWPPRTPGSPWLTWPPVPARRSGPSCWPWCRCTGAASRSCARGGRPRSHRPSRRHRPTGFVGTVAGYAGDMSDKDLGSFLAERRTEVEHLIEEYDSADLVQKGAYLKLLVGALANLDATRSEILRPVLRELDGGQSHLKRFDDARRQQVDVLAQLDELSTGVGARDVHQYQPDHTIELVGALREKVLDYDRYEGDELMPFIGQEVGPERLGQLGAQAAKASDRHLTHTHPDKPPADERSAVGKLASAVHDWMRDETSHPKDVIDGMGEQGP